MDLAKAFMSPFQAVRHLSVTAAAAAAGLLCCFMAFVAPSVAQIPRPAPAALVTRQITMPSGEVVSPMYPDANYTDGIDVEWHFSLFPGDTFELDLDRRSPYGLSTVEGDEDYVKLVIDGREGVNLLSPDVINGHEDIRDLPWFGKTAIFREMRVTLKFHSDSSNSGVGFRAQYKISCTNTTYCKNGGVCEPQRLTDPYRVRYAEPQCICNEQFSGEHCENFLPCFELACDPGSSCHVNYATGEIGCKCVKPGFMDYKGKCVDVDECSQQQLAESSTGRASSLSVCGRNQVCINTPGSYRCACAEGFRIISTSDELASQSSSGAAQNSNDDAKCIPNRCPDKSWIWRGSKCYWFDPEPRLLTYRAAVEECRDKANSSLVSILDAEENSFVGSHVVQPAIWLGLGGDNDDDKLEAMDFWSSVMVGGETLGSTFGRGRRKRTVVHPTRKLPKYSVRTPAKWQSGDPVGFTNWIVRRGLAVVATGKEGQQIRKGTIINTRSKRFERFPSVMIPSRMAQVSCAEKKRFICEAPADLCPQNWQLSISGDTCYYQSAYELDFVAAQEACQYLAFQGSLAKIDSYQEFLEIASWEFWRDVPGGFGLAHYWVDLSKNNKQSGWSHYSMTYQQQSAFVRWDKGFTNYGDGFSEASYPLCAYLLPNQWTVAVPAIPSPAVGSGDNANSDFAGVVCKIAASTSPEVEQDEAAAGGTAVDNNKAEVDDAESQIGRGSGAASVVVDEFPWFDELL